MHDAVFHLVPPDVWTAAVAAGDYRPASLAVEGFVHCSFAEQVSASADRHFGSDEELVAVEIPLPAVAAALVVEDSYGSGTAFPHVYGPLDPTSARAVHRLARGADGRWRFNPVGGSDRPAPGR